MKKQTPELTEMSKLLHVMGYIAVKDFDSIPEKVRVLHRLGYSNKEMVVICNTSEGTIAVQKTVNKKKKK